MLESQCCRVGSCFLSLSDQMVSLIPLPVVGSGPSSPSSWYGDAHAHARGVCWSAAWIVASCGVCQDLGRLSPGTATACYPACLSPTASGHDSQACSNRLQCEPRVHVPMGLSALTSKGVGSASRLTNVNQELQRGRTMTSMKPV
jgi:hypothetical protein